MLQMRYTTQMYDCVRITTVCYAINDVEQQLYHAVTLLLRSVHTSLVPRPLPSFPSLALHGKAYCKQQEAGRGTKNEAMCVQQCLHTCIETSVWSWVVLALFSGRPPTSVPSISLINIRTYPQNIWCIWCYNANRRPLKVCVLNAVALNCCFGVCIQSVSVCD